jgi:amidase
MSVQVPTPSQLRDIADEVGLSLTDGDVTSFIDLMRPTIGAYNTVDAMPDNLPPVRYSRTPGYRSTGEENKAQRVVREDDGAGCCRGQGKR